MYVSLMDLNVNNPLVKVLTHLWVPIYSKSVHYTNVPSTNDVSVYIITHVILINFSLLLLTSLSLSLSTTHR